MRVLILFSEFKEGNTISLRLQPTDMDDNLDAFYTMAEYALDTDMLKKAEVEVHGRKFVALYDAKAIGKWKPPVLHTTDGKILQGDVILCTSYGMGIISGLSNDDENILHEHLKDHIQEMARLFPKQEVDSWEADGNGD